MEVFVMPIYEYRCADCEHTFEEIQQFSDPDPEACPACGKGDVGRMVSRSNFKLKGGGWYADDYSSTSTSADGGKTPATTGGDDGSTETTSTPSTSTESDGPQAAAE